MKRAERRPQNVLQVTQSRAATASPSIAWPTMFVVQIPYIAAMSILLWIGGALVLLLLIFVVIPIAWLMIAGSTAEGATVEAPTVHAQTGQTCDFVVNIVNTLDRARSLRSVDFESALLNSFVIDTVEPAALDTSSMLGTTAYHYNLSIPPRGTISIRLRARAQARGDFAGTVMAYIDGKNSKSVETILRIVVE
jgi:hypothetical protein